MSTKTNPLDTQQFRALVERDIRRNSEDDNLSENTVKMYVRQIMRLSHIGADKFKWSYETLLNNIQHPQPFSDATFEREYKAKKSLIVDLIFELYKSKETIINTLNALCKMVKFQYRVAFKYYVAVRKQISLMNKKEKLNNELTPAEQERYISYKELMAIPDNVKRNIVKAYGSVFITRAKYNSFSKKAKIEYLQEVFAYITLYLNIHYPLRLVWPTINLIPVDGGNYLQGNKLYLNSFKNVRQMGSQVITLNKTTMTLIKQYLDFLKNTLDENPTKLLYRVFNAKIGPYNYSSNASGNFSHILNRLFTKYNGQSITMNMIRHIVESNIIQDASYAKMTNKEKEDLHSKLLHSSVAANHSYNKIANRAITQSKPVDTPVSIEPSITTEDTPTVRVQTNRSKRRQKLFQGEFKSSEGEKTIEIEIYEK